MIRFDNWQIKQEGGIIARQYDNLTRRLDVLGDFPEGWTWELLVQVKGKLDVIALSPVEGGVGVLLKASMLALGGQYAVQLRGTRGEEVRHTNILYSVYIPESLSGGEGWPEVPSAVEQALRRLEELNQHPPYPGSNGYWMVWDLDTNTYIESQLPLPPVAEGPPGKAATIQVGTTTTGDPGTQAQVTNSGTENAAVLDFTIPRGAVGPTGATPDISVQVSGLPAGSEPTVSVSGTPEAPVISLGIPAGQKGDPGTPGTNGTDGQTPNITIGTVETLPAGSSVTAAITGQTPNLVLNLGIPQGPAGEGVPPTDGVPENYVLTPKGWAAPTGGAEKAWTLLGETDCSVVGGNIIYDGLDDFTEFLIRAETVKNESASNSGYFLYINGKQIAQAAVSIRNQSLATEFYQWVSAKFNGFVWDVRSTSGAIFGTNITMTNANATYPYNFVLDIGAATEFRLGAPVEQYQATSGKITVWGR